MAGAQWPVFRGRPIIEVRLTLAQGGQPLVRRLIADTGAGTLRSRMELLLDEQDCLHCGGNPMNVVSLNGAYVGLFPLYALRVNIPVLGFDQIVSVVGLPAAPTGFDGIACFRFLNRFTYGNFGSATHFGLEV